ncbi:hypothetical protein [Lysobacter gummosus]|uniref:hypothetical protein n=1 Tax=Lysobacter gummosus TaxID=262324 RepID=UPI00363D0475
MRHLAFWFLLSLALLPGSSFAQTKTVVPLGGNAFITRPAAKGRSWSTTPACTTGTRPRPSPACTSMSSRPASSRSRWWAP